MAPQGPALGSFAGPESEESLVAAASKLASAAAAATATAAVAVGSAVFSLISPWAGKVGRAALGQAGAGVANGLQQANIPDPQIDSQKDSQKDTQTGSLGVPVCILCLLHRLICGHVCALPRQAAAGPEVPIGIGATPRYSFADAPRRGRALCQASVPLASPAHLRPHLCVLAGRS